MGTKKRTSGTQSLSRSILKPNSYYPKHRAPYTSLSPAIQTSPLGPFRGTMGSGTSPTGSARKRSKDLGLGACGSEAPLRGLMPYGFVWGFCRAIRFAGHRGLKASVLRLLGRAEDEEIPIEHKGSARLHVMPLSCSNLTKGTPTAELILWNVFSCRWKKSHSAGWCRALPRLLIFGT